MLREGLGLKGFREGLPRVIHKNQWWRLFSLKVRGCERERERERPP